LFSYFSWILIFFADFSASSLLSGILGSFIYFFPDWKEFRGKKKNPLQIVMLKSFSKKSKIEVDKGQKCPLGINTEHYKQYGK